MEQSTNDLKAIYFNRKQWVKDFYAAVRTGILSDVEYRHLKSTAEAAKLQMHTIDLILAKRGVVVL